MKFRSISVIVATLVLGFVLGMLTSAQIRYHKLKPVRAFFSEERFRQTIYHDINPDEQQKEKLDVVMRKYARINREIQTNYRKELDDYVSDFWHELSPLLTDEQRDKLEEMERKRMEFFMSARGKYQGDSIRGDEFRPRMRPPGDSSFMRFPGDTLRGRMPGDSMRTRDGLPPGGRP
ncbi:MAG: hypothetical protein RBS37_00515 [Bacteroidales bacterium]|jgi:Spy/CpxP family protein refolding chaperone|nr:hypothetical protein [Bacteroidales bacterium]